MKIDIETRWLLERFLEWYTDKHESISCKACYDEIVDMYIEEQTKKDYD